MSRIEILMWCLAYALGTNPGIEEIRQAKKELLYVHPRSVHKVIRSTEQLLPYMTDLEISIFREQICTCMLAAINFRIKMRVSEYCVLDSEYCYGVCPRCRKTLDRSFQAYCNNCGQHLKWDAWKHMKQASPPL